MPREYPRSRRVAEQLQREIALLIRDEVRDPRVGMVTISAVEVTQDLAHARIFVTVLGSEPAESIAGLSRAAGFLRSRLGRLLKLRTVPQLHFEYDESVERGQRISGLIDRALAADRGRSADRVAGEASPDDDPDRPVSGIAPDQG